MRELDGIIASLITPFRPDQDVDLAATRRMVRYLLDAGIHGFYLTGSVGEWVRLSIDERKSVVEAVMDEVAGRAPVAIHVGHHSTLKAVELCKHALEVGADYVASVIPGYYKYMPVEIVEYYRALADVGVPLIVYFLEGQGSDFSIEAMIYELSGVQGVVGVKYTAPDLFPMQRIVQLSGGELRVWGGHDQMALASLIMDARGVIGAHYNYLPELYIELYDAFLANDLQRARALQSEGNRIIAEVKRFGYLRAYKATLGLRGLPVGDCRPPASPFSGEERAALCRSIAPFSGRLAPIGVS